jgi:hypothetical protein
MYQYSVCHFITERMKENRANLPCAVGTEADAVESATQLGLILWMALQVTQLVHAMSELAFITILAFASFFKGTTQFRLVAIDHIQKIT